MSAICGLIQSGGQPVNAASIKQLMTALDFYGPDGAAIWQENSAALGHQMLHVTLESLHESLPWQDALTGLVITADARIDNREDLFDELVIPHDIGRELSDSQLILRAYVKWGEQCTRKLLGVFAFAIWDANQQKLFCARDFLGIRPFFYHSSSTCFVFASDLNALVSIPEVPRKFNELLVAAFLQQKDTKFAEKSLTFYEGIYKLPPAHYLVLTSSNLTVQRYWSPEEVPKIHLNSEANYADMLRCLLDKAVRCRLRSPFPIGTHLSGGLDSSAVGAVAARALRADGKTLQGFSWSPPMTSSTGSARDERTLVEEICRSEQIECHYVTLSAQDHLDFYCRNFITSPTEALKLEHKVQDMVGSQNIRVMLSGWGGDEAISFNGRGYFAELFLKGHWKKLYRELKLRGDMYGMSMKSQLFSRVILPFLPDSLVVGTVNPRKHWFKYYTEQSRYINPKLAQKFQSCRQKLPTYPYIFRERIGVRNNQRMVLEHGHLTNRIEHWAIGSSQNNFVYRYPLLDRRIVEFALGIPVDLFFKHGWKRYLFRSATEGLVPDTVRWNNSKEEHVLTAQLRNLDAEIRKNWENKGLLQLHANRRSPKLNEWLDIERLEKSLTGNESSQKGFLEAAVTLVGAFSEASSETKISDSKE